ncbi:MAG: bifunctional proline dehydrogenase/L-glutamate gamma-semialdehyde dehydrogenase, partial [Natronospirillum sp.]
MPMSFDPQALMAGKYSAWKDSDWLSHITDLYSVDETEWVNAIMPLAESDPKEEQATLTRAEAIVSRVRRETDVAHSVDKLLQEYSLDNEEGVILMCLAEALMRVPDAETADDLIRDKLSPADWRKHLGKSDSLFV